MSLFQSLSKNAWKWACKNIIIDSDVVHLVHVFNKTSISTYDFVSKDYHKLLELEAEYHKKVEEISASLLRKMIHEAKEAGCKADLKSKVLEKGEKSPKQVIQDHCDKTEGAAMLIVSSRGAGALGRAFVGSVSDYLVHNVKIPVVVVKN